MESATKKAKLSTTITAPRPAPGWQGWCLLVVDIQKDFYSRNSAVSSAFPNFPREVAELLRICRAAGIQVVFLREGSSPDDSPWYSFWQRMNPGKSSAVDPWDEEDFAAQQKDEPVFVKYGYDGVGVDCGLEGHLRKQCVGKVLVCGLITSCCVHMNAAGLFNRGFETYVVREACGDRTQDVHNHSLALESRRSYGVVSLEDIRSLSKQGPNMDLVEVAMANVTQFEK